MLIPIIVKRNHKISQHIFQGLNSTLRLPIDLGVKLCTKLNLSDKDLLELHQKLRTELSTTIKNNG